MSCHGDPKFKRCYQAVKSTGDIAAGACAVALCPMAMTPEERESFERRMVEIRKVLVARPDLCLDLAAEMAALRAQLNDGEPS